MKYTTVIVPRWNEASEVAEGTISLCGGKGAASGSYYSFFDVNPDGKTKSDMKSYQQFSIYGVAIKWFFAEPTTLTASPVQLSLVYSPNKLIWPQLPADRLQSLSTFQTMPCNQNHSVNRYYAMGYTKQKIGINYALTDEYNDFNSNSVNLYGGQLEAETGPSVNFKVYRNATGEAGPACRMQLTYYVRYRGTKGQNPIDGPP